MGLAMVPVLTVVPSLLARTGMDFANAYTACVLVSFVATLLLGKVCRVPLAAVPHVSIASWLVYVVILSHGHCWQAVLGASFLASLLCLLLVFFLRGKDWQNLVPQHLCESLSCGLGLMLVLLGLRQGHVIASAPVGVFTMGDFSDPVAFHSAIGILFTMALVAAKVSGAMLWGMLLVALISFEQGFWVLPDAPFLLPVLDETSFQLDLAGALEMPDVLLSMVILGWVLLQGMSLALRQSWDLRMASVLLGTNLVGALAGAFPMAPAVESAVGIGQGERKGLVALSAAGMLGVFLFCEPLLAALASYGAITAPALVLAGCLLVRRVDLSMCKGAAEFFSACAVCVLVPITQSITAGFGTGVVLYVLLSVWEGRWKEIPAGTWGMAVMFGGLLCGLS